MAASFIEEHDALVASGQRPHRVTEFFAGTAEGSLRHDMEQHAAGHGLSERLDCEIRSYQLCKVDDTWAEAAHRDVSGFFKRHTAASIAYACASRRLAQTLGTVDRMTPHQLRFFYQCMRQHKAIAQIQPRPANILRPARLKTKVVNARVYRYDKAKMQDWSAEFGSAISFIAKQPSRRKGVVTRLQIEYLQCILGDGQLFSLPQVDEQIVDRAKFLALDAISGLVHQQPAASDRFFIVVDKHPNRKKQLQTAAMAMKDVDMPVSIQRMVSWSGEGSSEAAGQGKVLVYHDGYPWVVDFLARAPWPICRGGLRRWQVGESIVRGCLELSRPELARASFSTMAIEDAPTICLLEALASTGWQRGQPPKKHTLLSPKEFKVGDPIASKAYLRCLLCLEDLLANRKITELRPGQPAMYYDCILDSEQPQAVPFGQTDDEYKSMAAIGPDIALGQQALQDADQSSDEIVLSRRPALGSRTVPKRQLGDGAAARCKRQKRMKPAGDDWGALVLAPQVSAASADDAPPTQPQAMHVAMVPAEASASVASGSAEERPAEPLASVACATASVDAVGQPVTRMIVHDAEVYEERHGVMGQPGSYRRCIVVCQHHGSRKNPCRRTRAFGVRAATASGLGDVEPYAFLGCWLSQHGAFDSKAAHQKLVPTVAQTQSYARAHLGWQG